MEAMTGVSRISAMLGQSRGQTGGKFFLSCSSADRADRQPRVPSTLDTRHPMTAPQSTPRSLAKPRQDTTKNPTAARPNAAKLSTAHSLPHLRSAPPMKSFFQTLPCQGPPTAPPSALAESRIGVPITDEA
jgi:hypothetical protein